MTYVLESQKDPASFIDALAAIAPAEGTAGELFEKLGSRPDRDAFWPRNGRALGSALSRYAVEFDTLGLSVKRWRSNGRRVIRIELI